MAMQSFSTAPGRNTSVAASAPTPRGLIEKEMTGMKPVAPVKKVKGAKNVLRAR